MVAAWTMRHSPASSGSGSGPVVPAAGFRPAAASRSRACSRPPARLSFCWHRLSIRIETPCFNVADGYCRPGFG